MSITRPNDRILVNRLVSEKKKERVFEEMDDLPKLNVSIETMMDTEKIAIGAYSPLEGFLGQKDYQSVLDEMRLSNGSPWTIPIILAPSGDENEQLVKSLREGDNVALTYKESVAMMHLEEKFELDKKELASKVFGTTDIKHPNVDEIHTRMGGTALSGKINVVNLSNLSNSYELTPAQSKEIFKKRG